ncbi:MAG: hypothetical protein F2950_01120 [Actinobacteria bacterium]|uniref:Unannotated protein n=1 Tax=freshwater metagenome TaxID=449393 RepID=A0A6J6XMS1_9ZZZZ|nr:hypothetical protein [Actinomycetota bacterium]MTA66340.1 hypothetical protein [Actinomycetota bacterium]
MSEMEPLDEQGSALFDAMVRWRALSTTAILMGFAAGLAQLIVTSTGGGPALSKSLAGVAVFLIVVAVIATFVAWLARRRFLQWYSQAG